MSKYICPCASTCKDTSCTHSLPHNKKWDCGCPCSECGIKDCIKIEGE
jgi:hypothetical protein